MRAVSPYELRALHCGVPRYGYATKYMVWSDGDGEEKERLVFPLATVDENTVPRHAVRADETLSRISLAFNPPSMILAKPKRWRRHGQGSGKMHRTCVRLERTVLPTRRVHLQHSIGAPSGSLPQSNEPSQSKLLVLFLSVSFGPLGLSHSQLVRMSVAEGGQLGNSSRERIYIWVDRMCIPGGALRACPAAQKATRLHHSIISYPHSLFYLLPSYLSLLERPVNHVQLSSDTVADERREALLKSTVSSISSYHRHSAFLYEHL
ncbi:fungal specific transcription factor [Colletotrichum acutatum]